MKWHNLYFNHIYEFLPSPIHNELLRTMNMCYQNKSIVSAIKTVPEVKMFISAFQLQDATMIGILCDASTVAKPQAVGVIAKQ